MSETVLTSPIILDATGQDMLTKLDSIISAINPVAQGVSYDNAGTGMVATNVQSAITELKTGLVNTNSSLTQYARRYVTWNSTPTTYSNGAYYYHVYETDIPTATYDLVGVWIENTKWKMPCFVCLEDNTTTNYKLRFEYAKSDFTNPSSDLANTNINAIIAYKRKS